ncbi:hypothetical protein Tco_0754003 [Tanacetum coccineum]
MAFTSSESSSSSDSKVDSYSKTCVKAYATLKEQYDSLSSDYKKSQFNLVSYKAASLAVESFVNLTDKTGSDKGYHSVPPPLIGNFISRKPDLTFLDEIVKIESNALRMNKTSAPIIEDWNSDDESEIDYIVRPSTEKIKSVKTVRETDAPKQNKQYPRGNQRNWNNLMSQSLDINNVRSVNIATLKPIIDHPRTKTNAFKRGCSQSSRPFKRHFANKNSIVNSNVNTARGNPQQKEYKEKGVIKSSCSRHMTGNKCYIDEYEDYDGGFVSFGDDKG